MQIETSVMIGPALNWAVAKCEEIELIFDRDLRVDGGLVLLHPKDRDSRGELEVPYQPSTDWAQGGPIIGREDIMFQRGEGCIRAYIRRFDSKQQRVVGMAQTANDHLVAAMRCHVAFRLGEVVDVPEELCVQTASPSCSPQ